MPYLPTNWMNDQPPPLSASYLNRLTDELESQALARSVSHSLPAWVDGAAPALTSGTPWNEIERVVDVVAASLGLTYNPTIWGEGWTPARNETNLNKIEQQAAANRAAIDGLTSPSTPTAVESGWTRVVETTFTTAGVLPAPWGTYNGIVGSSAYSWWLPSHVVVEGGVCKLRNSYETSGLGVNTGYGTSGEGWYQGSIISSNAVNTANRWGEVNARCSVRMRVVNVPGSGGEIVASHRNLPLRWGQPSTAPEISGIRGTSGDGEEDWHEDNGSFTGFTCFIDWYINHLNRNGPPFPAGPGTVSKTWTTHDIRGWHIYQMQRVETVTGWVDGVQAMTITPTTEQMPPTARRTFVFQQENLHGSPYIGPRGGAREDIEIDWIAIDVPS